MTNFPNGVACFGQAVLPAILQAPHSGRVYWVSNNSTTPGNDVKVGQDQAHPAGGTYNRPFATIDYAVGQCRSAQGDVIIVKEGHAETLTPTSLALDVAGVKIVGLGTGPQRPGLTFDTATDTITVSAAGVEMHNFRFIAAIGDVVAAVTATTATDLVLSDILMQESSTFQFINMVAATGAANTADRMTIRRVQWHSDDAGSDGLVIATGSMDSLLIEDCSVMFDAGVAAGVALALAADQQATNLIVRRNSFKTALVDTAGIIVAGTAATSSGVIYENYIQALDAAAAGFTGAATVPIMLGNNWYTGAAAEPLAIATVGGTIYNNA